MTISGNPPAFHYDNKTGGDPHNPGDKPTAAPDKSSPARSVNAPARAAAIEQAAEALRRIQKEDQRYTHSGRGPELVDGPCAAIAREALARLDAERAAVDWNRTQRPDGTWASDDPAVLPDRERLAGELTSDISADIIYGVGKPTSDDRALFARQVTCAATALRLPADGWRPIESAPKAPVDSPECIEILAYYSNGTMEIMYWADGWWPSNNNTAEQWADPTQWSEPTHWMPLPIPPAEEQKP